MFTNILSDSRRWVVVLLVFCLFAVLSPSLPAQTAGTGALAGTVTDSTGAVVPNVTVTLSSVDTGQVRTDKTGSDGTYKFSLLPPGNYRAKFEATGFSVVGRSQRRRSMSPKRKLLNRTLAVGTQTQQVTVEGEVETIQTENAALGTVVGKDNCDRPSPEHSQLHESSFHVFRRGRQCQQRHDHWKGRNQHGRQWRGDWPEHLPHGWGRC